MESWPSGLRRTPGKRVGWQRPRGFESVRLRHFSSLLNKVILTRAASFYNSRSWCRNSTLGHRNRMIGGV